jgi:hypothetical protein
MQFYNQINGIYKTLPAQFLFYQKRDTPKQDLIESSAKM